MEPAPPGRRDPSQVTVHCINSECPTPADTTVTLAEAAPGVLAKPTLICASCGYYVQETMP
jgi:hypothetical protein